MRHLCLKTRLRNPLFICLMMHHFIKKSALELGFDACGIARAEELTDDAVYLRSWLAEGKHGEMGYLARNFEKRTDPRILVPGCKSVVVVLLNYYPQRLQQISSPKIAKYAYSIVDYHQVLKNKLSELERVIIEEFGSGVVNSIHQHSFVDSAPVLERRWAQRAGLGWIGKHTQLISEQAGSYAFIGVLMLNAEMEYDHPVRNRCGSCTRCMDACPTKAIANGSIDARRCISYLTIENKNEIPEEYRNQLSGCALGCDICADVCPWNRKWANANRHPELTPVEELINWTPDDWENLKKDEFNRVFKTSAIKRAGFEKLSSNILVLKAKKQNENQ